MRYSVSLDDSVDFAPSTEAAEILQNVRTILATRPGTVPLDRNIGVSWDYVDKPLDIAQTLARVAIIDAITAYEPRATVEAISFDGDGLEGVLKPKVIITIGES